MRKILKNSDIRPEGIFKMITGKDLREYLIQFKIVFGLGLIGIFSIMKAVFDYQHILIGIGYITLIIGIGNIIWAVYDYITLRTLPRMKNIYD